MKSQELSNQEISIICRELALLMHAGVYLGDGLTLLSDDEKDADLKAMFQAMAETVDCSAPLSEALKQTHHFPVYVTALVEVGERTGRTEDALNALAQYYENREQMDRQVRSALTYPTILLLLMLVVIVILLSQVLPIFNDVYASLGGQLTGLAGGLLMLGQFLNQIMPVLCVAIALVFLCIIAFSVSTSFRQTILSHWRKNHGDKGISRKLHDARFAQALSMGLGSGLPLEESVDLAAYLLQDTPAAVERCKQCRAKLDEGLNLAQALQQTNVLPASSCRLLSLGLQSGAGDTVMDEISRRLSEEASQALEDKVSKIEPTLILTTSLLVGIILLSVMLPLMNIMSMIG